MEFTAVVSEREWENRALTEADAIFHSYQLFNTLIAATKPKPRVVSLANCRPESSRHGNLKQVLLSSGFLPGITQVAVATFPECIETELHSHPTMYEIYFVLEGRAIYKIGDDSMGVGPGDFFFIPPGIAHNQRVTSAPHRIFYWGLAPALLDRLASQDSLVPSQPGE